MKASAKTNGLNAYVTGIGATKRIVVWDTTAGRIPDDEVLFIFGHESGHYVLHHIPKLIAGVAIGLFFVYWACAGFAAWLVAQIRPRWQLASRLKGIRSGHPAPDSWCCCLRYRWPAFLLEPVNNAFSRHFEHQADVYGQEAIHGIVPTRRRQPSPLSIIWARPGSRPQSQTPHRVLGIQPPLHPAPRHLRPELQSLGQWRPW